MLVCVVFVVGAVAIDLVAMREKLLDGTSDPSDIRRGLGGAAYRIFSNINASRKLITALAGDPISRSAREVLEADGDAAIQRVRDRDSGPPLHLAPLESGSLKLGASDFRIVGPSPSASFAIDHIGEAGPHDYVLLDAGLPPAALAELARRYSRSARVVFEPVSVEKASRHAEALRDLFLMTPTREEMSVLTAGTCQEYRRARRIAHLLVTSDREGARLYDDEGEEAFAPTSVIDTSDATGAGELLLALLVSGLHAGEPLRDAVRQAISGVEQKLQTGDLP
ncbi:MAG TPA: PfkB family carbohydrate kinase [Spirochaetia bacterium]|nr:PfkB family carbohydrate kinase [Spirochaetia bacterium]